MGNNKQAVLLIHGIGEQIPMETLRGFVKTVWEDDHNVKKINNTSRTWWSKPDQVSKNFDLRRITTTKASNEMRTDFFEFYWAHLMHGTKVGHLTKGIRKLLLRNPLKLQPNTLMLYFTLLFIILATISITIASVVYLNTTSETHWTFNYLPLIFPIALPLIISVFVNILGDAPGCLDKTPENVQRRHEIRTAGLELLQELHKRGYERIILVGHSLGSIIGYDILTHAWPKFNKTISGDRKQNYRKLEELEQLAGDCIREDGKILNQKELRLGSIKAEDIHRVQIEYFKELKENGNMWRVTDFITLGSPLTHASALLAKSQNNLDAKIDDRELPICPPSLEKGKDGARRFSYFSVNRYPHHAAVFGPTRWTNIFFPMKWILRGDLVSGPLRHVFGAGINDINTWTGKRLGIFTHTFYWKKDKGENKHIEKLRDALKLDEII